MAVASENGTFVVPKSIEKLHYNIRYCFLCYLKERKIVQRRRQPKILKWPKYFWKIRSGWIRQFEMDFCICLKNWFISFTFYMFCEILLSKIYRKEWSYNKDITLLKSWNTNFIYRNFVITTKQTTRKPQLGQHRELWINPRLRSVRTPEKFPSRDTNVVLKAADGAIPLCQNQAYINWGVI